MNRKGFTLIEVMIVIAIMVALIALGAGRMLKKDGNPKPVLRHLTVLVKEIRNHARLFNSTYRLCLRLDDGQEAYWVEKGNGGVLLDPEKIAEDMKHPDKKPDKDAPPPMFQMDKSMLKKERTLPKNLHFAQVETANTADPVKTGVAYIHFFPQGIMEAAAIQLTDKKNIWTLVFNPLTGQADVMDKAVSLKDLTR